MINSSFNKKATFKSNLNILFYIVKNKIKEMSLNILKYIRTLPHYGGAPAFFRICIFLFFYSHSVISKFLSKTI